MLSADPWGGRSPLLFRGHGRQPTCPGSESSSRGDSVFKCVTETFFLKTGWRVRPGLAGHWVWVQSCEWVRTWLRPGSEPGPPDAQGPTSPLLAAAPGPATGWGVGGRQKRRCRGDRGRGRAGACDPSPAEPVTGASATMPHGCLRSDGGRGPAHAGGRGRQKPEDTGHLSASAVIFTRESDGTEAGGTVARRNPRGGGEREPFSEN